VHYGGVVSDPTSSVPTNLGANPGVDPAAMPTLAGLDASEDVARGMRLRGRVVAVLEAQGLETSIDDQGDVVIGVGDQTVFVSVIATLPPFVRVFGSWLVDDVEYDELLYLRAANAVTGAINLVKVTVHGDALVVAADLLVSLGGDELDDAGLAALVGSTIDAVLGTAQTWHHTVDELRRQAEYT
jgi:type III secretion system-like peptide-binding chaperone